jgi:tetratricopeptide (TPR) repeat protein
MLTALSFRFRLIIAAALITSTASLATPSHAQDGDRAALITDLSGVVEVASGSSSFSKVGWGTPLMNGDRIRTAADAKASILFSNGNLVTLGQNASMTIAAANGGSSGTESTRSVSDEYLADASDLTLYRAGPGEIGALGGLRSGGGDKIELITPRNTRTKAARPEFAWDANGDYDIFTVKLLSDAGTLWSAETEGTSIAYPSSAPELEPGTKYFWQVIGEVMLNTVSSPLVSFEVLTPDDVVRINAGEKAIAATFADEPEAPSHLYVLGSYYAREGLLGDAIATFSMIAHRHPEAAPAFEILGKLYYDVDMKDAAVEALQKAVELERKD